LLYRIGNDAQIRFIQSLSAGAFELFEIGAQPDRPIDEKNTPIYPWTWPMRPRSSWPNIWVTGGY
jgi:hypothetical protein